MRRNSIINTVNKFRMKVPLILSGTYLSVFLTVLLILFRLPVINAQAQVYPVSVSTQLTPPYSVNLADYVAPGCEQLKVIIVQRDLTQAHYRLYLKMEIELNGRTIIRTSPYYIPPAFILEPGIPTLISGSSLAPFFDPDNMEFPGYSRDQYMRTKILPEGAYVITFTAYDWTRRDVALSHGGAFFCYLAKAEPPMLNLPFNNALVTYSSPQYINFQWLPGTTSSPNSAFSTKYRFELFEMRVGGISPSEIVTNTRPFFVTETERTNLSYSIAEPALEKGMRYVWRVKAYDIQGRDYIRNNGMSEVFSFVYGEGEGGVIDFSEIGNFTAAALSSRKAKLTWDASEGYDSYRIYYRKQGKDNKWYETETAQNSAEINGLSPGTIYECRVQGKKMNAWGSFSNTDTVLLPKIPVIECGSPFTPLDVANREPLLELMKLQEFDAGGFMVTVIDPYALTTEPGRFTGRGFVQVPLFGHKKIRCEFKDIFINTDFRMVEGSIRLICDYADGKNAIWDIDEEFEGGGDNGTVINGTEEVAVMIPDVVIERQELVMLDTVHDDIVVIVESQDTLRINVAEKLKENPGSLTVQDSEGNLYSVDTKTGKATSLGKVPPPGSPQQLATPLPQVIDDRKGKVIFVPAPDQRFAFDQRSAQYARSNLFMEEYKTMQTEDGELYDIPYKLIPVGETDVVLARAELKGKTIKSDSIVFRSGTGTIYKAQPSGKTDEFLLTLPSGKDNDGIEVYATYTDSKKKTYVLGKLIVMSYSVKRPALTLVPVNGNGTDTDPASVKAELDKIYQPVGVDWQVNLDSDFEAPVDSLDIQGSGLFSMYTEGMKSLNNEFVMSKKESFNPSAVYLFLLRHSDDGVATGDMPRSKQFGYIFTETAKAGRDEAFYRTIAHEIAHGAFRLSHTFDEKYTLPEKTTTNLLDYTAGTDLVKHQWDAIHDPGLVIGMFERDEEGMNQILPDPVCTQKFLESFRWAYVNKKALNYPKDGYPFFGHYATNLTLLDGNTYRKINVSIRQNISAVPLKLSPEFKGETNCYYWGKVLEINNKDNNLEFSKYLYPTESEWNDQMNFLAAQVESASTSMVVLNYLSVMPISEYYRLSSNAIVKSLGLIVERFSITENYLGCVNDEHVIINLVESCKTSFEKKKALLSFLSRGSILNQFIFHLDGENLKNFVNEISIYTNEILPPDISDITQIRFNSHGVSYTHLFDWKESFGPDIIFESENALSTGEFVISSKTDWLALLQESQNLMRIEPFEYVGILAEDAAPYLPELVKPDETIVMIPSFLFHWLLTQKEREQTMKDFSTMIDLGFTVATFGTYTAGKTLTKFSVKTAEAIVIDYGIQAFLNTLDGTPIQEAVKKIDLQNVAWAGASANIDKSKVSLALSCLRNASRGVFSVDNDSFKAALINGGWECGYDLFLSLVTKGTVRAGDKYFEIVLGKFEVSPEFVTKRLLKYGINKLVIQELWGKVLKAELERRVNNAIKEYEEGKTD